MEKTIDVEKLSSHLASIKLVEETVNSMEGARTNNQNVDPKDYAFSMIFKQKTDFTSIDEIVKEPFKEFFNDFKEMYKGIILDNVTE